MDTSTPDASHQARHQKMSPAGNPFGTRPCKPHHVSPPTPTHTGLPPCHNRPLHSLGPPCRRQTGCPGCPLPTPPHVPLPTQDCHLLCPIRWLQPRLPRIPPMSAAGLPRTELMCCTLNQLPLTAGHCTPLTPSGAPAPFTPPSTTTADTRLCATTQHGAPLLVFSNTDNWVQRRRLSQPALCANTQLATSPATTCCALCSKHLAACLHPLLGNILGSLYRRRNRLALLGWALAADSPSCWPLQEQAGGG
jgi:hypothetical protein